MLPTVLQAPHQDHILTLILSDDTPLLTLLQPHRPLCFLLRIPGIFPLQGFCIGCSFCLECLSPRSHPLKSFVKCYLGEAYQTTPLKMAKLSSYFLLAPFLLYLFSIALVLYLFLILFLYYLSLFPRV